MKQLESKVAIITGGASGIGAATALLFARQGARVVVTDVSPTAAVVAQINGAGGNAIGVDGDITQTAVVQQVVDTAVKQFGGLDILVNNAGLGTAGNIEQMDEALWDKLFAVNIRAPFVLTKHALPHLRKSGDGVVLFTASIAGLIGTPGLFAYGATKAGMIAMAKSLAVDYGRQGVRFNAVAPGATETPMLAASGVPSSVFEATLPLGRLVNPAQIADALLYLASAKATTGQVLAIDSGATAGTFFAGFGEAK